MCLGDRLFGLRADFRPAQPSDDPPRAGPPHANNAHLRGTPPTPKSGTWAGRPSETRALSLRGLLAHLRVQSAQHLRRHARNEAQSRTSCQHKMRLLCGRKSRCNVIALPHAGNHDTRSPHLARGECSRGDRRQRSHPSFRPKFRARGSSNWRCQCVVSIGDAFDHYTRVAPEHVDVGHSDVLGDGKRHLQVAQLLAEAQRTTRCACANPENGKREWSHKSRSGWPCASTRSATAMPRCAAEVAPVKSAWIVPCAV